jgi:hypothetical protein
VLRRNHGFRFALVVFGLTFALSAPAVAEVEEISTEYFVDGEIEGVPGVHVPDACEKWESVDHYHVRAWVWQPYWDSYWHEVRIDATVRMSRLAACGWSVLDVKTSCRATADFTSEVQCGSTDAEGLNYAEWRLFGEFERCLPDLGCETDSDSARLTMYFPDGTFDCGSSTSVEAYNPNNPMEARMSRACWKD